LPASNSIFAAGDDIFPLLEFLSPNLPYPFAWALPVTIFIPSLPIILTESDLIPIPDLPLTWPVAPSTIPKFLSMLVRELI